MAACMHGIPALAEFQPPVLQLPELRAGSLEVRLAVSLKELEEAQALRYHVFVEEKGAMPSEEGRALARDFDGFDAHCDHLLVLEHAGARPLVVGTYRLLRGQRAKACGRFYTEDEFDVSAMKAYAAGHAGDILELGRSCVHPDYRNRAVMQLLWRGIGAYVEQHRIGLMFGCGSLHGRDVSAHRETLSYLHHYHLAPPELRLRALPHRFERMDLVERDAIAAKEAFAGLPALIKGYLRLGGYVGEGAVVDAEYNTVDVGIVVKTELVTARYVQRYSPRDEAE